jgi:hypothetical protein
MMAQYLVYDREDVGGALAVIRSRISANATSDVHSVTVLTLRYLSIPRETRNTQHELAGFLVGARDFFNAVQRVILSSS